MRITKKVRGLAYVVAGICAYIAAGFWLHNSSMIESWLFKIGLTAATFIPILFVSIYTYFGFRGKAKWWTNQIGTALVEAALSIEPIVVPLMVAIWFYNGSITPSWLGWFEVSGPVVSALAWLQLCIIWVLENNRTRGS